MESVNITIIGAGVVGLSIAAELSKYHQDIILIEKYPSFGQEISSRNSEVIHAGIYYPAGSLKTRTCIEGRVLLYEFCAKNDIPHRKLGKLIVAVNNQEIKELEKLFADGCNNAVEDLKLITKNEIKELEPNIKAEAAVYSPSTGIVDTHSLMKKLAAHFESRGGLIAYNTEFRAAAKVKDGFEITVKDNKEDFKVSSRILVNSAGLNSYKVSAMVGLVKNEYKLKFCKGDYFRVSGAKSRLINRLIYPVPKKHLTGLGIHATPDLAGSLRLGPDDQYVEEINYEVNPQKARDFYQSARRFLPFLKPQDLAADMAGIRPKLQGPGEDFRDFVIQDETGNGFEGFINLIGIESPGLTASLSIAKMVGEICSPFFN